MPIFQDSNGFAVKFFIQKDLSQEIQADLCETITSLGGRVEAKVPRAGYILVQPGTPEDERLRVCWNSLDRPERHFVPFTYVEACKIAGMLLKQIFVHEGEPIRMHIHPSIANDNARAALSQRIMHSGGDPYASAQSARVILADPNTEVFRHLVKVYQGIPDKYIESYLWVKKCVEKGAVVYTPVVYKNPGGRRPGEERTQFSEEDEEHLCTWIAAKIPYKETGGRTGNRLYQQLCDLAADPEYAWVRRHTWQSWRERYKKNAARLDATIAAIVDQKKPAQGEQGQYGYVRKPEENQRKSRRKRVQNSDPANTDEGDKDQRLPGILESPGVPEMSSMYSTLDPLHALSGGPLKHRPINSSPAEEEMDDGDEWAIRIGNDEPPAWCKRKPEEKEESSKRRRTTGLPSSPPLADVHVIDQGIRDIAEESRFTTEEVQEYYDKCGEMERTRARFRKMRQVLAAVEVQL